VSKWLKPNRYWLLALGILALGVVLWHYGPALWALVRDQERLASWVDHLGWLGPLAVVLLNALQIIIAPIPGYVVQIAAGYLYGALWGGVWNSLGLLLGASAAFWLARGFGRPVAERVIGRARLARWEKVTHSTSTVVWCVMLLGPTGDVPYYLAGLSRVSYVKVIIIAAVLRIPSVFLEASVGAGVVVLAWWEWAFILVFLIGIIVFFLRYQEPILLWMEELVQRRVVEETPQDEL
jgi:uncharacterized membrane protein YdjX (TVP38/TMEM64 family)